MANPLAQFSDRAALEAAILADLSASDAGQTLLAIGGSRLGAAQAIRALEHKYVLACFLVPEMTVSEAVDLIDAERIREV